MAEPSRPALGVLERALSQRGTFGATRGADRRQHEFDNKQVLPHLGEDTLHDDVTSSSSEAMASVLYFANSSNNNSNSKNNKTSFQTKQVVPALAKEEAGGNNAAPAADFGRDKAQGQVEEVVEEEEVENDDDNDDDDGDFESLPPLQRGLVSMSGKSSSSEYFGKSERSLSCSEDRLPPWEPNIQMDLEEFDRDSISYLAEGAMCQCFLALKLPASMNLPDGLFEESKRNGVIIKTPTEGGPEVAENDIVVESLVLRKLSHPHIVNLLGSGSTSAGKSFIVLEYLTMGTLRERLDKCGGGLGVKPAVKYGKQLASALAYMHDEALPGRILMHRDLKPDNIGYSSDGEAKLMDFGLAKVINRTFRSKSVKYKMTGETGSPRYMPPEVAKSQPYNEKADVWSFIIILWEMVSGQLPFTGMNMEMFMVQVCEGGKRPPLQNSWPADIKSLMRSGWQCDPDKRPSFREIHAVLTGLEREANPPKKKGGLFGR